MATKKMGLFVKGNGKEWIFNFYGDPKSLKDWRDDGLEVYELENSIPMWVNDVGMTKVWCFFQDVFNFKNPFA